MMWDLKIWLISCKSQLAPVGDVIQRAQDASTKNDNQKAIEQLRTVDIELFKVSQRLPSEETRQKNMIEVSRIL
jgi:hypothetical protein